jgi:NAD-dependent DNA ligase
MIDLVDGYIPEEVKRYSKAKLGSLLSDLDAAYYNGESAISDGVYEVLLGTYEDMYGKFDTGGRAPDGDDVELPYRLGSLPNVKSEALVIKWADGDVVLMDKLDGISGLYHGKRKTMYTKGDATTGKNVSKILKYMNLPKVDYYVRGEMVIPVSVWEKHSNKYSNPRNMAGGIVNCKDLEKRKDIAKKLRFVAYEILEDGVSAPIQEQLKRLEADGFEVVWNDLHDEPTKETLDEVYAARRGCCTYLIDGIVLFRPGEYRRPEDRDPKYAVAFKGVTETATTTVIEVLWKASMYGVLKPRVKYEEVQLSGAKLSYATGHNAKFIKDNGIGPGAVIQVTRSGEVIPYILAVIEDTEPSMPSTAYIWNETEVDIISIDTGAYSYDMVISRIRHFFKTLNIKYMNQKTIETFVAEGYDTLDSILTITKEELLRLPRIGEKSATRLLESISEGISNVRAPYLMSASLCFGSGLGVKRFQTLINAYPNMLEGLTVPEVASVDGFSKTLAPTIIKGIPKFNRFLEDHPSITMKAPTNEPEGLGTIDTAGGCTFVFTGFRDAKMEDKVRSRGHKVSTSISGKTTAVVAKDPKSASAKVEKARELGIPVIKKGDFDLSDYE